MGGGGVKISNKTITAVGLIGCERLRQKYEEGFTVSHDDQYTADQLAIAAACYAVPLNSRVSVLDQLWPWDPCWWKPTPDDRVRELVKAGALICAEIERLLRAAEERPTKQVEVVK